MRAEIQKMQQELVADKGYDIFVPMASSPWQKFRSGKKEFEIRNDKGRWDHVKEGQRALLRRGYSTKDDLYGIVGEVVKAASWFHLPKYVRQGACVDDPLGSKFFDAQAKVIAIQVLQVREK